MMIGTYGKTHTPIRARGLCTRSMEYLGKTTLGRKSGLGGQGVDTDGIGGVVKNASHLDAQDSSVTDKLVSASHDGMRLVVETVRTPSKR